MLQAEAATKRALRDALAALAEVKQAGGNRRIPLNGLPAADLALVNEQMWLGHFDVWSNGMVLLYRHALMLGDDGLLSIAQAQTAVEAAVDECDRFYPAFQFILWGDKTPAEALASALVDAAGEA